MKQVIFKSALFILAVFCGFSANAQWTGTPNNTTPTIIYNNNTAISKVGIGTTTPTQKLQVKGGNIILDDANTGFGNLFFSGVTYPTNQNGMRMSYYSSAGTAFKNGYIDVRTVGGTASDGLLFRVDNTVTGNTERMRICGNGNVGIGTGAPSAKLQVHTGAANDGILVSQAGTTSASLSLKATGTGTKTFSLRSTGPGNTEGAGHLLFWDATSNLERMRINSGGNVGIGTGSPIVSKLGIASSAQNDGIRVVQTGTTAASLALKGGGAGSKLWAIFSTGIGNAEGAGHLTFHDWGGGGERMRITSAGDVGIGATVNPGTYKLFINGSGFATGLWVSSDRRFKQNIAPVQNALGKVLALNGKTYEFKRESFPDRNFNAGTSYGYIAQELQQVIPEAVQENTDGYLAVNYDMVIPVLTEAIKDLKNEQDMEISELETRLADKDRQISALEARLAKLEAAFDRAEVAPAKAQNFLMSNQPNPFSRSTSVQVSIPETVHSAEIVVTDMAGKEIARYNVAERGQASVEVNLQNAPKGTYICNLIADGQNAGTLKLALSGN